MLLQNENGGSLQGYMYMGTERKASEFCTSLGKYLFVGPFIKID